MSVRVEAPLAGARVLDLTSGPLGAVSRLLAELGADVVRVEPPDGGADRLAGPTFAGVALGFAAASQGKRAVRLDLATAEGAAALDALAARADILIENGGQATDMRALHGAHPGLVVLSISALGRDAALDWRVTDAVLHALSGELSRSGIAGRTPLLPPGELAIQCAAAQAAYLVLVAWLNRLQTGQGDWLDLSLLDAVSQALDPGYGIAGSAAAGAPASKLPRGRPEARHLYPIVPCADGHVRLCILAVRQWRGMFEWMGKPAEFADPAFDSLVARFSSASLLPAIAAFFADKNRADLERQGNALKVPAAALLTLAEVLETEHVRARGAFAEVELAPGRTAPLPAGVLEVDGVRAAPRGPPPLTATPWEAVLAQWTPRPTETFAGGEPGRPLFGLRVLDLGVIVVGAEQGRLLADYGAEVIKLENAAFPDGSRATAGAAMNPGFAAGHRNKQSFGLNLRAPEGRELFLRLADQADVILSNFKPGTMESLGLGADVLLSRNPRLILAESSAFGSSGPWSERMGYGPLVRASAGLTDQWRYPGEPDGFSDAVTVYPDHVAARIGVCGVLALLARRHRTGRGGVVSVSQMEVMLSQMAPAVAALRLEQRGEAQNAGGLGGSPFRDAPWGVYPCAGEDAWCVVSIEGDADWRALCVVLDRADLAEDVALDTAAGRDAQRARIDAAVSAWTQALSPDEAAARMQAAGVPAAPMLRVMELPEFAAFAGRPFFARLTQPQFAEPIVVDHVPLGSEHLAAPPLGPAPEMGEHTRDLAATLLGLAPDEIERLLAEGVLETKPA